MRGWETGRIDEVEAGGEHQRGSGFYVPAHTLTVYVKVEIYAFQGELIETRESLCRAPDPSTAGRHQQWMSFHIPADWTYSWPVRVSSTNKLVAVLNSNFVYIMWMEALYQNEYVYRHVIS
jgi:hypothetical protein